MFRANYELVYLIGLVFVYAIRRYYALIFRSRGVKEHNYDSRLDRFMAWTAELGLIAGMIYLFTNWLDFANYPPTGWWGWFGIPVYGIGLWLLQQSHEALDRSWSPHVEIQRNQKLITEDVYLFIRHPMYAGYLLLGIGQMMMLANWIAGPAFLVLFGLLYLQRVGREEEMMLAKFGQEYQYYMQRTGRLLPKLKPSEPNSQQSHFNTSKK